MRTKLFFIWTLATAFMAHSVTAKPIDAYSTIKVTAVKMNLKVDVAKALDEIVDVTIEDTEGFVLHQDRIEKNATRKRYDMRNLPAGQYRLIVLKNRVKMIQPFSINTEEITILETNRTFNQLPQVTLKNMKLEVRVFVSAKEKTILKIVDNQGLTAFEQTIEGKTFAKRYDLSKLPKGVYFVELVVDSTYENFVIQL